MKKTLLAAIALLIAFLFTACPVVEPTKEDLLTQKNGWELVSATSIPPYENSDGVTGENLFEVYFDECELDDILYFYANKSSELNLGKKQCDWDGDLKIKPLGLWAFKENYEVLEFHLPYFVDANDKMIELEAKVIVSETALTLRIPLKFADTPAKGKRRHVCLSGNAKADPDYNFTLTYKIAK
jgi:hypothetical protein